MAPVMDPEFGLSLLEVTTNSFLTKLKKGSNFFHWTSDGEQSQHSKFTGRQPRAFADPGDMRSNELLETDNGERRAHENQTATILLPTKM